MLSTMPPGGCADWAFLNAPFGSGTRSARLLFQMAQSSNPQAPRGNPSALQNPHCGRDTWRGTTTVTAHQADAVLHRVFMGGPMNILRQCCCCDTMQPPQKVECSQQKRLSLHPRTTRTVQSRSLAMPTSRQPLSGELPGFSVISGFPG